MNNKDFIPNEQVTRQTVALLQELTALMASVVQTQAKHSEQIAKIATYLESLQKK